MTLYGPHCPHEECGWGACDLTADEDAAVMYGCKEQATCTECGPASYRWPRIAREWTAWATEKYGTADAEALDALRWTPANFPGLGEQRVPANVIDTAELVAAHHPGPAPADAL